MQEAGTSSLRESMEQRNGASRVLRNLVAKLGRLGERRYRVDIAAKGDLKDRKTLKVKFLGDSDSVLREKNLQRVGTFVLRGAIVSPREPGELPKRMSLRLYFSKNEPFPLLAAYVDKSTRSCPVLLIQIGRTILYRRVESKSRAALRRPRRK